MTTTELVRRQLRLLPDPIEPSSQEEHALPSLHTETKPTDDGMVKGPAPVQVAEFMRREEERVLLARKRVSAFEAKHVDATAPNESLEEVASITIFAAHDALGS